MFLVVRFPYGICQPLASWQGLWSVFNTGYAGSKSVGALAGQCLLARHVQHHLIMSFFSVCLVQPSQPFHKSFAIPLVVVDSSMFTCIASPCLSGFKCVLLASDLL